MRPRAPPGVAQQPDCLPAVHLFPFFYMYLPEMPVERLQVRVVLDDHALPEPLLVAGKGDRPAAGALDAVPHPPPEIYAGVELRVLSCERIQPVPVP